MSFTIVQVIGSALLAIPVASHMLLHTPPARYSRFNPDYVKAGKVDSDLHAPLSGANGFRLPFPCGHGKGPAGSTLKAGQPAKWSLYGGATHNGGHCEIALSYDDKTFISIQTILGECMKNGKLDYEVTIPANAPSGNATFAWTWVNWTGNREYYMNCADVTIEGSPNGVLTGPKIVEANMPGRPTIPAFTNARTGAELYENRPNVSVTGSGVTGPVAPPPTIPNKPSTTVASRPEPTFGKPPVSKPPVTKPTSKPPVVKPQPTSEPTRPEYPGSEYPESEYPEPEYPEPEYPESEYPEPEYPESTEGLSNSKCEHGKWECKGTDYHVCVWGVWEERNCPSTTKCYQVTPFNILCL